MRKLILLSLLLASCGTEDTSDLQIIGGQRAYRQWYGWVSSGCGASLVGSERKWALSAAHCFQKNKPRTVAFGLHDRAKNNNGGKSVDLVKVKRIILHPRWSSDEYDLALIELQRPSKHRPVAFAALTPRDGERVNVFGFGQTSFPGNTPRFLQGAALRFNARATARARPQILRAGVPGKAVCFGDSGGPLMFSGRLIGTVTFTVGKCNIGGLGGFTRLDMPWIRRYVR